MILYFNNKLLHDQVCLIDYGTSTIKSKLKMLYVLLTWTKGWGLHINNFLVSSTQTGNTVQVISVRHHLKIIITLIAYIWQYFSSPPPFMIYLSLPYCSYLMECGAPLITSAKTKYVQHTYKYLITLNAHY